MIRLSELQVKEVIVINSGERLGYIHDLEINPDHGMIRALIVVDPKNKGSMFKKADELIIYWEQIVTIGKDVILVSGKHKVPQKPD